jgi:hypothetical protein
MPVDPYIPVGNGYVRAWSPNQGARDPNDEDAGLRLYGNEKGRPKIRPGRERVEDPVSEYLKRFIYGVAVMAGLVLGAAAIGAGCILTPACATQSIGNPPTHGFQP